MDKEKKEEENILDDDKVNKQIKDSDIPKNEEKPKEIEKKAPRDNKSPNDPLSNIKNGEGLFPGSDNSRTDKKKNKPKEDKKEKFEFFFTFSNKNFVNLNEKYFSLLRDNKDINFKIIGKREISNAYGTYELLIFKGEIIQPKNEKLEFYFEANNSSVYGCYININPKQNFIFGNNLKSVRKKNGTYPNFLYQLNLEPEEELTIFYQSLLEDKKRNEKSKKELINNLFSYYNGIKNRNIRIDIIVPVLSLFVETSTIPFFLLNNIITFPHIMKEGNVDPKLFKDLLSLVEKFQKKDKEKEKEELIKTLSNIFVTYYNKYNIGTFIELINSNNQYFILGLIQSINQKKINLQELFNINKLDKFTIIEYLIEGASKKEDIEEIFSFSTDLKTTLELIERFYEKIYKKITTKEKTSLFGFITNFFTGSDSVISINNPKLENDKDMKDILNIQNNIIEKELKINKEKIKVINFKKIILGLIEKYKNSSIEKIESILEMIKTQSKLENSDDIYLVWAETLHNKGISLSKNFKMSNKQIIDFITDKDPYYRLDAFKDDINRDPNIFISFNINLDENENCFELFQQKKIWNLFNSIKNKWKKFIEIILNKICYIYKIGIIFKLFPLEAFDSVFTEKILEKFEDKYFINTYNDKLCTNLNEDLYTILRLTIKNKIDAKKFTNLVEKTLMLNEETINNIYLFILNKNEDSIINNIRHLIINFFMEKRSKLTPENFFYLIKSAKSDRFLCDLFNEMENFCITKEEFYEKQKSKNYKLYELFIKGNYINNSKFFDTKYFKRISSLKGSIFIELTKLEIPYFKIIQLIEDPEKPLIEKINLIFNDENPEKLYEKIEFNTKKIKELLNNIENIYNYLNFFDKDENQQTINILLNRINEIRHGNLCDTINIKTRAICDNYEELFELSKNLRFKNSIFFMALYENNKKMVGHKNTLSELFNTTKEEYDDIIKNIINFKNINFLKINKIDLILKTVNEKEIYLPGEIKFLSQEFKISENELDNFEKELTKVLIGFSHLNNIKEIIKSYDYLLETFKNILNYEKTEFSENMHKNNEELQNEDIAFNKIEECITFLKEYNIEIKQMHELFVNFIIMLHGNKDAIKFCEGKNDDEIKHLNEFVGDNDNSQIETNDIEDFVACSNFVNTIINNKTLINDKLFDKFLKEKLGEDKSIGIKFKNYFQNYGAIKEIYEDYTNKPEISKKKIENILNDSNITIFNNVTEILFEGLYINDNKEPKPFNMDDLTELRDRALLNRQNSREEERRTKKFVNLVNDLNQLIENISLLCMSGYTQDIKIEIQIEKNRIFDKKDKDKNIKKLIKYYHELNKTLKISQIHSYRNNDIIRFIYGRLFRILNDKIFKGIGNIDYLLKEISNNKFKKELTGFKYVQNENKFEELFNNISNYLLQTLELNQTSIEAILSKNIIKSEFKNKGIYRTPCPIGDFEKIVLQIYNHFTGNLPLPNTILLCNEDTTTEEIFSFLYRTILCQFHVLFTLVNIDSLELTKRHEAIKLLNNLNNKYQNKNSMLIIIYQKDTDVLRTIENIIPDKNIIKQDSLKDLSDFRLDKIEIITANKSGLGKSTEIKNKIKNKYFKNYFYFPISGVFTRSEMVKRLQKLNLHQDDVGSSVIHIDLNDTCLDELVKEILFKLLILKSFRSNENIIYFGEDIQFIVELPVGFLNYCEKYHILKYAEKQNIESLLPLKLSSKDLKIKDSFIQIVSNTLKIYDNNRISEYNIDLESNDLLSNEECQNLIDKKFSGDYNYYQKMMFIHVLGTQFKMFCECDFCNYQNAKLFYTDYYARNQLESIKKARPSIIKALIDSTIFFTTGPYDKLLSSQNESLKEIDHYDEDAMNNQAIKSMENLKDTITFDSIKGTLFFFNLDKSFFSIITNCSKEDPNYSMFKELWNSQNVTGRNKSGIMKDLTDYSSLTHEQYLEELRTILGLSPALNLKKFAEDQGNYVFTRDNFIKMVLILQRIESKIPVILMGETGCGKTSLLKMLSVLKNKGKEKMKTLNIHAGTSEQDIIDFIKDLEKTILVENEKELEEVIKEFDEDKSNRAYNRDKFIKEKREEIFQKETWVFFDEINTCESMGLIGEIMCNHSIHGEKIKSNLVFLGACNPYRTMTKKLKESGLVYHNQSTNKRANLVYTVNPLPFNLLNFIFNFGTIKPQDERKYIESMVSETINKIYPDKNSYDINEIKNLTTDVICHCHSFIREIYDESSVSLREVRRFNIFFNYFVNYLSKESEFCNKYTSLKEKFIDSINLTTYLCYYLRLSEKDLRKKLQNDLTKMFGKDFLDVPMREESYIAEQFIIEKEKGIALNRALRENLFTLFVCTVNSVPLIICGKPGTGKSLSVNSLYSSMKGIYSKSKLFRQYKQLYISSYQGSETSTSQGIKEAFARARAPLIKLERENKEQNIISMLFFDEMGLAEKSKNNPLKAIHSELEYDQNKYKIAIVGISNWKLDASKMNRALYLSVPDPDNEDLIDTSTAIAQSVDSSLANNYNELFIALANTYYHYKEKVKSSKSEGDFHGNRDFYHLIKNAIYQLIRIKDKINSANKSHILTTIGLRSLERNFGGLPDSINNIKAIFAEKFNEFTENTEYNVLQCVKDNLEDYNSRFLLLVSKSSISPYLVSYILDSLKKNYIFLVGSNLKDDIKLAEKGGGYSESLLNKIQFQMCNDSVLVLKNLEIIYPSLYDLFNQNYTKMGDKQFSKIAFANAKSSSEVNRKFRTIVLVSQEQIDQKKEDPPFLHRFEKHIISIENFLSEEYVEIGKKIFSDIEKISTFNKNKKLIIDLGHVLINCGLEEIEGLIYKIINDKKNAEFLQDKTKKEKEDFIVEEVYKVIVPTFCQDIIASVKYSGFEARNRPHANIIYDIYRKSARNNFEHFLKDSTKSKAIIFTFSNTSGELLNNRILGKNNIEYSSETIKENMIDSIKSEKQIEIIMNDYYGDNSQNLLVFKFREKDLDKMNHISYLINNYESKLRKQRDQEENENDNFEEENINIINDINEINTNNEVSIKKIVFIVHFSRKMKSKNQNANNEIYVRNMVSNLDQSYYQLFIDNLHGKDEDFINVISSSNGAELFEKIIDFDKFIDKSIYRIMTYFAYNLSNETSDINNKNYIKQIVEQLTEKKSNPNVKFLREKIIESIKKESMSIGNIIPKVFVSEGFQKNDIDFYEVIRTYSYSCLSKTLLKIINMAEKHNIISPLLFNSSDKNVDNDLIFKNQVIKYFNTIDINLGTMPKEQPSSNQIELILGLNIPQSSFWFKSLNYQYLLGQKIIFKYLQIEDSLRPKTIKKENELINIYSKYEKDNKQIILNLREEMNKNEYLYEIIKSDDFGMKKELYYDYIKIFCNEVAKKYVGISKEKFIDLNKIISFVGLILQIKFNDYSESEEFEIKETFFETMRINDSDSKDDKKYLTFNMDTFSKIILFIEGYSSEILLLSNIYFILEEFLPEIKNQFTDIISKKKMKPEESVRNNEYRRKINEVFFVIMESLLRCILINSKIISDLEELDFYRFFTQIKYIESTSEKINQKFLLFSKEIYSIRTLLLIFESTKGQGKDIKEGISEIIQNLSKESEFIINNDYNGLTQNILELKELIFKKFGNKYNDEYINIMSKMLRQQYKKIDNDEFKFEMLRLAFENDKLIENSLYFLSNTIKLPIPKIKKETTKKGSKTSSDPEEDCIKSFLEFISKKNKDKILLFFNSIESEIFDQILLYHFELQMNDYFSEISKKYPIFNKDNLNLIGKEQIDELIKGLNLKFLKKGLNFMDQFVENTLIKGDLNHIGKIYSEAYIKVYIQQFAKIYFYNKELTNYKDIIDIICDKENNMRNVLKIYFFKNIFFYGKFPNFLKFNSYINEDKEFPFKNYYHDYQEKIKEQNSNTELNTIFDYLFFSVDDIEEYKKKCDIFQKIYTKFKDFDYSAKDFDIGIFNDNRIDLFFCLSINHLIGFLFGNDKEKFNGALGKFYNVFKELVQQGKLILEENNKKIFYLLFDPNTYNGLLLKKMKLKESEFTQLQFEILLQGIRFVISSQNKEQNNFYSKIISPNCKEFIKNNFIPGNIPFNNIYLNSYYDLCELLANVAQRGDTGYYVCPCGQYYSLQNCTFPWVILKCSNCNQDIGGSGHVLLDKKDHFRVFLNKEHFEENSTYKYKMEHYKVPYLYLEDYKKKYIDQYLNVQPKGIEKGDILLFIERRKKIRVLNELPYRILSFILYSHLWVANLIGNLSEEELKSFTHGEYSCFRSMEKNWEIIDEILKENEINNTKAFINIIFKDISKMINECPILDTFEKRQEFEEKINNYFEEFLKDKENINTKLDIYLKTNENIKGFNPLSIDVIIQEGCTPFIGQIYSQEIFPELKMFLVTKFPNIDVLYSELEKIPEYTKKYCLLNQVIINNEENNLIENVVNINELTNLLLKRYTYKISRDEAKQKELLAELSKEKDSNEIDEIKEKLINPFIQSWDKIKNKSTNYLCRPKMDVFTMKENTKLNFLLVDDGELGGGMYLASAYTNFINWQNNFINIILHNTGQDSILSSYLYQINQEIYVQEAKSEDLVKFNDKIQMKLIDMIESYSMRKIIKKDGTLNHDNYRDIKFDFATIEEELGKLILPGVKKFKYSDNDDPITFVTYLYEGYRGKKSEVLSNFNTKYPARELTNEERQSLFEFISKNKNNPEIIKNFLSSCQILIDYIQKENFNKNHSLFNIIQNLPDYIELDDKFKNLFRQQISLMSLNNNSNNNEGNENETINRFSVNSLINVYLYFEHLSWEETKNNLNEQYKAEIEKEKEDEINEFFKNYNKDNDKLIQKEYLAAAIRRFISRYLSGKRADVDINEAQDLIVQLTRNDLWKLNLTDDQDRFNSELYPLSFGLKVNQAFKYYELLGGDKLDTNFERNEINENVSNLNNNEENKGNPQENNEDNNLVEENQNQINQENEKKDEDKNEENNGNNNEENEEDNIDDNEDEENDDDENESEEISC